MDMTLGSGVLRTWAWLLLAGIVAVVAVVYFGLSERDEPTGAVIGSAPLADVPPAAQAAAVSPGPEASPAKEDLVAPDPNYRAALARVGFPTSGWTTDFSRHTVPYDEIISGGPPRDGIPPIDDPTFTTPALASEWLADIEPVIAFELNGDARAYPLQVLTWHEIVNDVVGGVPVTVTFCPLCNSAIVFDRRLDGVIHDFGTSGRLRHSDLIMWDRQTESWWQQLTGEAIVGTLAGKRLTFIATYLVSYADFKTEHPEGKVLSRDTGFDRPYGRNPYAGYDRADTSPFLFRGTADERLLPKERVATVAVGEVDVAFPYSALARERAVNYTVNGTDIVVLFKPGTVSALDKSTIRDSKDVGATGVFEATVDGRKLTFSSDGERTMDVETGSVWNIIGRAVEGPLTGTELTPVVHGDHLWFSWAAFKPDTLVYGHAS